MIAGPFKFRIVNVGHNHEVSRHRTERHAEVALKIRRRKNPDQTYLVEPIGPEHRTDCYDYMILRRMVPPIPRPTPVGRGDTLQALILCANQMAVGDAVVLSNSEAQTFRVILAAQGFLCVTDGYRCPQRTKLLAFKLAK
jgi:hypothetical protein